ncbi:MAG: diaminopropionate ammonia-lyase [Marinibacterium sp.]
MHKAQRPPAAGVALARNARARRDAPWTAEQDAILSDSGLAAARATITGWDGYAPTPLFDLPGLARSLGVARILYKDEGPRFSLGSFKALGGAYAVARHLQADLSRRLDLPVTMDEITARAFPEAVAGMTVACATDGNHGRSVAWGARNLGCNCVIFLHAHVSAAREAAIAAYGAEIRRVPGNYDDSVRAAQDTATQAGWTVISDTSYPGYMEIPRDVMQGYEIMADEAFAGLDAPPTHIFLQTGVGGMAAAVTANAARRWGADRPVIVLCDPDRAACLYASFRAGQPTAVQGDLDTLMAGLACGEVSALAWEILKDHADAALALPDEAAVAAMRRLADPEPGDAAIVAGESAVAGLAGLTAALGAKAACADLGLGPDSTIVLFGTEGDTDPALYAELVGRSADAVRGTPRT